MTAFLHWVINFLSFMIIQIRIDGLWVKPPIPFKTHKNLLVIVAPKDMDLVAESIDRWTNVGAPELALGQVLASGHHAILGTFLEIVGIHGGRHFRLLVFVGTAILYATAPIAGILGWITV